MTLCDKSRTLPLQCSSQVSSLSIIMRNTSDKYQGRNSAAFQIVTAMKNKNSGDIYRTDANRNSKTPFPHKTVKK